MRQNTALVRRHLDAKLGRLRHTLSTRPSTGWIRTIRQSLGMSTAQLADRLGVSQPRVTMLEHGEAAGAITLKTLQRAAEALNCTLVYTLVPNDPLERIVQRQAHEVATEQVAQAEHSMALENQAVLDPRVHKAQVSEAAAKLLAAGSSRLWRRR